MHFLDLMGALINSLKGWLYDSEKFWSLTILGGIEPHSLRNSVKYILYKLITFKLIQLVTFISVPVMTVLPNT